MSEKELEDFFEFLRRTNEQNEQRKQQQQQQQQPVQQQQTWRPDPLNTAPAPGQQQTWRPDPFDPALPSGLRALAPRSTDRKVGGIERLLNSITAFSAGSSNALIGGMEAAANQGVIQTGPHAGKTMQDAPGQKGMRLMDGRYIGMPDGWYEPIKGADGSITYRKYEGGGQAAEVTQGQMWREGVSAAWKSDYDSGNMRYGVDVINRYRELNNLPALNREDAKWYERTGLFLGGLAIDIFTDPITYTPPGLFAAPVRGAILAARNAQLAFKPMAAARGVWHGADDLAYKAGKFTGQPKPVGLKQWFELRNYDDVAREARRTGLTMDEIFDVYRGRIGPEEAASFLATRGTAKPFMQTPEDVVRLVDRLNQGGPVLGFYKNALAHAERLHLGVMNSPTSARYWINKRAAKTGAPQTLRNANDSIAMGDGVTEPTHGVHNTFGQNPYEIMGLPPGAARAEVDEAWEMIAKNPDIPQDVKNEAFGAYVQLLDVDARETLLDTITQLMREMPNSAVPAKVAAALPENQPKNLTEELTQLRDMVAKLADEDARLGYQIGDEFNEIALRTQILDNLATRALPDELGAAQPLLQAQRQMLLNANENPAEIWFGTNKTWSGIDEVLADRVGGFSQSGTESVYSGIKALAQLPLDIPGYSDRARAIVRQVEAAAPQDRTRFIDNLSRQYEEGLIRVGGIEPPSAQVRLNQVPSEQVRGLGVAQDAVGGMIPTQATGRALRPDTLGEDANLLTWKNVDDVADQVDKVAREAGELADASRVSRETSLQDSLWATPDSLGKYVNIFGDIVDDPIFDMTRAIQGAASRALDDINKGVIPGAEGRALTEMLETRPRFLTTANVDGLRGAASIVGRALVMRSNAAGSKLAARELLAPNVPRELDDIYDHVVGFARVPLGKEEYIDAIKRVAAATEAAVHHRALKLKDKFDLDSGVSPDFNAHYEKYAQQFIDRGATWTDDMGIDIFGRVFRNEAADAGATAAQSTRVTGTEMAEAVVRSGRSTPLEKLEARQTLRLNRAESVVEDARALANAQIAANAERIGAITTNPLLRRSTDGAWIADPNGLVKVVTDGDVAAAASNLVEEAKILGVMKDGLDQVLPSVKLRQLDDTVVETTTMRAAQMSMEATAPVSRATFRSIDGTGAGRGTPAGDAKDAAMRADSHAAIVELAPNRAQSSSHTTLEQLGEVPLEFDKAFNEFVVPDDFTGLTVMLARNAEFKNAELTDVTKQKIFAAHDAGARFVVGDMPGVDSAFFRYLDEIGADYTIYHIGRAPRSRPEGKQSIAQFDQTLREVEIALKQEEGVIFNVIDAVGPKMAKKLQKLPKFKNKKVGFKDVITELKWGKGTQFAKFYEGRYDPRFKKDWETRQVVEGNYSPWEGIPQHLTDELETIPWVGLQPLQGALDEIMHAAKIPFESHAAFRPVVWRAVLDNLSRPGGELRLNYAGVLQTIADAPYPTGVTRQLDEFTISSSSTENILVNTARKSGDSEFADEIASRLRDPGEISYKPSGTVLKGGINKSLDDYIEDIERVFADLRLTHKNVDEAWLRKAAAVIARHEGATTSGINVNRASGEMLFDYIKSRVPQLRSMLTADEAVRIARQDAISDFTLLDGDAVAKLAKGLDWKRYAKETVEVARELLSKIPETARNTVRDASLAGFRASILRLGAQGASKRVAGTKWRVYQQNAVYTAYKASKAVIDKQIAPRTIENWNATVIAMRDMRALLRESGVVEVTSVGRWGGKITAREGGDQDFAYISWLDVMDSSMAATGKGAGISEDFFRVALDLHRVKDTITVRGVQKEVSMGFPQTVLAEAGVLAMKMEARGMKDEAARIAWLYDFMRDRILSNGQKNYAAAITDGVDTPTARLVAALARGIGADDAVRRLKQRHLTNAAVAVSVAEANSVRIAEPILSAVEAVARNIYATSGDVGSQLTKAVDDLRAALKANGYMKGDLESLISLKSLERTIVDNVPTNIITAARLQERMMRALSNPATARATANTERANVSKMVQDVADEMTVTDLSRRWETAIAENAPENVLRELVHTTMHMADHKINTAQQLLNFVMLNPNSLRFTHNTTREGAEVASRARTDVRELGLAADVLDDELTALIRQIDDAERAGASAQALRHLEEAFSAKQEQYVAAREAYEAARDGSPLGASQSANVAQGDTSLFDYLKLRPQERGQFVPMSEGQSNFITNLARQRDLEPLGIEKLSQSEASQLIDALKQMPATARAVRGDSSPVADPAAARMGVPQPLASFADEGARASFVRSMSVRGNQEDIWATRVGIRSNTHDYANEIEKKLEKFARKWKRSGEQAIRTVLAQAFRQREKGGAEGVRVWSETLPADQKAMVDEFAKALGNLFDESVFTRVGVDSKWFDNYLRQSVVSSVESARLTPSQGGPLVGKELENAYLRMISDVLEKGPDAGGADWLSTFKGVTQAISNATIIPRIAADFSSNFAHNGKYFQMTASEARSLGWVRIAGGSRAPSLARFLDPEAYFPPDIARQMANMQKVLDIATSPRSASNRRLLNFADRMVSIVKSFVTLWSPAHHVLTTFGEAFMNALRGETSLKNAFYAMRLLYSGGDITANPMSIFKHNPKRVFEIFGDVKIKGAPEDATKAIKSIVLGEDGKFMRLTDESLYEIMQQAGIRINTNNVEDYNYQVGQLLKRGNALHRIVSPIVAMNRGLGEMATRRDNIFRFQHAIGILRGTNKRGPASFRNMDEAIDYLRREILIAHPMVQSLAPFEHNVLRRTFFFYSWQRVALNNVIETLIDDPYRLAIPAKANYSLSEALGGDPQGPGMPSPDDPRLPSWAKQHILGPVWYGDDGSINYVSLHAPQLDLFQTFFGGFGWDSGIDAGYNLEDMGTELLSATVPQLNPFLKLGGEAFAQRKFHPEGRGDVIEDWPQHIFDQLGGRRLSVSLDFSPFSNQGPGPRTDWDDLSPAEIDFLQYRTRLNYLAGMKWDDKSRFWRAAQIEREERNRRVLERWMREMGPG